MPANVSATRLSSSTTSTRSLGSEAAGESEGARMLVARGMRMVKVLPRPTALSTTIVPRC